MLLALISGAVQAQTVAVDDAFNGSGSLAGRVPTTRAVAGATWQILSGINTLDGSGFSRTNNSLRAVIQSGAADATVQTVFHLGTYNSGLVLRASDGDNYHRFAITGSGWTLVRTLDGVLSTVASGTGDFASHHIHRLKAVMNGPTFTLSINGVTVGTAHSAFNQSATLHGLFASGSGTRAWDHFTITKASSTTTPPADPAPEVPAPPPETVTATSRRLPVYITSDIDIGNETDDEGAFAMFLGTQDAFNIVGLDASIPDGKLSGYTQMLDEYEADLPKLRSYTSTPALFKTVAELRAVMKQGPHVQDSTPARGYRLSGDAYYAEAHGAAQALIAAARTYGNPTSSDPRDKLWIVMQGAWNTLAQAMYEACADNGPRSLPDFLSRVRVICTSAQNASRDDASQDYILANTYSSAGKKLHFGDLRLLHIYNMHGRLNDQTVEGKAWWTTHVKDRGAMGKFLARQVYPGFSEPGPDGKAQYFRWSDGLCWVWLRHALRTNNFDPTATNPGGKFRTYLRERWSDANLIHNGFQFPGSLDTFPTRGYVYSPFVYSDAVGVKLNVDIRAAWAMAEEVMDRYSAPKAN